MMFTPLTVKYAYYDTERIGGECLNQSGALFKEKGCFSQTMLKDQGRGDWFRT